MYKVGLSYHALLHQSLTPLGRKHARATRRQKMFSSQI